MTIRFKFNWKILTFSALLLPLLVSLGVWQLSREEEKISIQQKYALRDAMPATSFEDISWSDVDLDYLNIKVTGQFDNGKNFLLDNRIIEGDVGYEVIAPFITNANQLVFINRGWVSQGGTRSVLPEIQGIEEEVEIQGSIYVPKGKQFMLAEETWPTLSASKPWPKVIQSIDIELMSKEFNRPAFPFTVRLSKISSGALISNWRMVNMKAEMHRGYAIQWFLMALVLTIMTVYSSVERKTPN